jgi:uncharacterized low-complexity protein
MERSIKIGAAAAVVVAAITAGLTVAQASNDDDDDNETETAISGDALAQASEAALAYTGEGRVTGSEVDDEESKYEIEVTLDNGDQVDVQLDENFNVVSSENDGNGEDD